MDQPTWDREFSSLRDTALQKALLDRFFDSIYDFPRITSKPSTYFIAATPRSGSHYLAELLFATKLLGAPLEYLDEANYRRWSQITGSEDPNVILGEIMARRTTANGWFGVIVHWFQLANIRRFKISPNVLHLERIIWIRRRDLVDQAVSLAIAMQTGAWSSFHKPRTEPVYDYHRIALCADAISYMDTKWARFMKTTAIPHLTLFYEDICANRGNEVARLLGWFGMPTTGVDLTCSFQKQGAEINAIWKERFLKDDKVPRSRPY